MAAAHPYGAFIGCGIKRIGCARRIKVNNTFSKTYNLKVHQCVHIGELPYRCDGCNETFSKAYSIGTYVHGATI